MSRTLEETVLETGLLKHTVDIKKGKIAHFLIGICNIYSIFQRLI